MDWRALEEHFRVAGTAEPGPFGDDAIEWDYSRYARGLGLTGEPGAHDLPHRGCAVLALPPARWDAAERKYQAWAAQRGWTLWRFSARPTVVVPDPVTYALGIRAAGPDSLVFVRAARPVVPAMGPRMRSEGMSFPLTPGERWLVATDRVRRRMRAEIRMRRLVLFVEEAEWLTPAGLALLMYLLDAHRAWRARMLSRTAEVYVVLVTAPEHEAGVVRMLERFHLKERPPVLRERRKPVDDGAGFVPPALRDVEEEYLFGALAAAPMALAEEDVRSVFGGSAVDRCRALVERGLLRSRAEAGQICYAANPAVPAGIAAASPRALAAIAARYRWRARRGHEHLALAAAALFLDLDGTRRAVAAVARMPHTAGALLPLRLYEALDAVLERASPQLRTDHGSAWFSLVAHQRAYDRAREVAHLVTERELRTWKELYRVVQAVLCTGRTHLDTCLPPDFWPKLKSRQLAGPFMDATCVLAELFWRKRYLSNDDIRQRYEFTCDCLERAAAERPSSAWLDRLERIARLVAYRAALHLDIESSILASRDRGIDPRPMPLRAFLRTAQMHAYLAATPMFAEAAAGCVRAPRSFDRRDRSFACMLMATTGQFGDLAVTTATTVSYLATRGLRLLLRDIVDDLLLCLFRRTNVGDQHELGRFLQFVVGGRMWLAGVTALNLANGRQDVAGRDASDDMIVAAALLATADLVGARDRLAAGLARKPRCPFLLCTLIGASIRLAHKTMDAAHVSSMREMVDRHRTLLGADLYRYLISCIEGSNALCFGQFELARDRFRVASEEIRNTVDWAQELRRRAATNSGCAGYAANVVKTWSSGTRRSCSIWRSLRTLCLRDRMHPDGPSFRMRAAIRLEYVAALVNAWATGGRRSDEEVLRLAFFLRDSVDSAFLPLGREFCGLMREWAPAFYECLRSAVVKRVGELDGAVPETRALGGSLRTIGQAWKDGDARTAADRIGLVVVRERGSSARQAREAEHLWHDDATTYARVRECVCGGEQGRGELTIVAYGQVGVGASPSATVLRIDASQVADGAVAVELEARGTPSSAGGRRRARLGEEVPTFAGESQAARKVRAMIESAARCDYPVLLLGETGVGKDLVARCIHAASKKCVAAMVVADCGGTAESLLESELFGHEKGAFTGAVGSHQGYLERANGSSLLLDEVDSMPARMQAALLRALETGEYRPVGATSCRKSEFRLISAALPRLLAMVESGEFRRDLFYRISALRIDVPPLRQREGDAGEIAAVHAQSLGFRLTAGALRVVEKYDWPGNVRQLRHCIQAASLHAHDRRIGEAALRDVIDGYRVGGAQDEADTRGGMEAAWARALRSLERMSRFGAWEFAEAAELSRRSAQRYIAELLQDGRIVRVGAGRTTRYRMVT